MFKIRSRRASEYDLLYGAIAIIAASIGIILAYYLNEQMIIQFTAKNISTEPLRHAANALETFNYSIIFMTIAFAIAAFIAAFWIKTHPVFFVASVVGLIVMLIITVAITNAYDKMMLTSVFSTLATTTFSKMFTWVRNLPKILVVTWGLLAIGMYAKFWRTA